MTPPADISL